MRTVSNQKRVTISKEKNGIHTVISLKALKIASNELSGVAFKMWLYLAKNQDRYILALSCADALTWGIGSKSSYNRAVKELITKGYL